LARSRGHLARGNRDAGRPGTRRQRFGGQDARRYKRRQRFGGQDGRRYESPTAGGDPHDLAGGLLRPEFGVDRLVAGRRLGRDLGQGRPGLGKVDLRGRYRPLGDHRHHVVPHLHEAALDEHPVDRLGAIGRHDPHLTGAGLGLTILLFTDNDTAEALCHGVKFDIGYIQCVCRACRGIGNIDRSADSGGLDDQRASARGDRGGSSGRINGISLQVNGLIVAYGHRCTALEEDTGSAADNQVAGDIDILVKTNFTTGIDDQIAVELDFLI